MKNNNANNRYGFLYPRLDLLGRLHQILFLRSSLLFRSLLLYQVLLEHEGFIITVVKTFLCRTSLMRSGEIFVETYLYWRLFLEFLWLWQMSLEEGFTWKRKGCQSSGFCYLWFIYHIYMGLGMRPGHENLTL